MFTVTLITSKIGKSKVSKQHRNESLRQKLLLKLYDQNFQTRVAPLLLEMTIKSC